MLKYGHISQWNINAIDNLPDSWECRDENDVSRLFL
jgi:hypothetical protein